MQHGQMQAGICTIVGLVAHCCACWSALQHGGSPVTRPNSHAEACCDGSRLGANYLTLPINRPHNKMHQNHYDGLMNRTFRDEEVRHMSSPPPGNTCFSDLQDVQL